MQIYYRPKTHGRGVELGGSWENILNLSYKKLNSEMIINSDFGYNRGEGVTWRKFLRRGIDVEPITSSRHFDVKPTLDFHQKKQKNNVIVAPRLYRKPKYYKVHSFLAFRLVISFLLVSLMWVRLTRFLSATRRRYILADVRPFVRLSVTPF